MFAASSSSRAGVLGARLSRVLFSSLLVSAMATLGACSDDPQDDTTSGSGGSGGQVDPSGTGGDATGTGGDATGTGGDATGTGGTGGDVTGTGGNGGAGGGPVVEPAFSSTPIEFTAEVGTGPAVCYDFDSAAKVDCADGVSAWDLMFEVDAASHAYNIWTNGGVKGAGKGASFGPVDQAGIDAFVSAKTVPGWFADYFGGTFADSPWYEYDVLGTHDVTANGRVYVVDTGADKFRVQLVSYYDASGASGKVTLRYGKLSETTYADVVLDATAGGFGAPADSPLNKAAYFDLDEGKVVDISDAEARSTNTVWDLGIKRYNVVANGGASGPGTAKVAIADARSSLYDDDGKPIKAKFEVITAQELKDAFEAVTVDTGLTYKADRGVPYLNNDGGDQSWFGVTPPPPPPAVFFARPENWWVIRSAEGDSYAKLHVTKVESADRKFTVELYVQPKAE